MVRNTPENSEQRDARRMSSSRPTIGFLMANLNQLSDAWTLESLQSLVQERDANLIVFHGHPLESRWGDEAAYNVLYELVSAASVDGLVVETNKLGSIVGEERLMAFCREFGLPVVSLGLPLEGFPSVSIDSYATMYQAVAHLLDAHGRRRIAFARGRETSFEMEERYRAYVDALAERDLPLDPALVVSATVSLANVKDLVAGKLPFSYASAKEIQASLAERSLRASVTVVTDVGPGELVVPYLLHERGLVPGVDFDAIVTSGNILALGVMGGLAQEGVRVPSQVAVVGPGDIAEADIITPPLTTAMGRETIGGSVRRAAEMLLDVLEGKRVPETVELRGEMVLRQSCGCPSPALVQTVSAHLGRAPEEPFETALAACREEIIDEVAQALEATESAPPSAAGHVERLLDTFAKQVSGGLSTDPSSQNAFLDRWAEALGMASGVDEIGSYHVVLSVLRRHLLPLLDNDARLLAEDLWHRARVMVGETAQRARGLQGLAALLAESNVHTATQQMLSTTDWEHLADVMAARLPVLGIQDYYVSLFLDPDRPTDQSRCLAAFASGSRIELDSHEAVYPSLLLTPNRMHHSDERYSLLAMALISQHRRVGLSLFRLVPSLRPMFVTLNRMLGNALYGILLRQQVQRRAQQLEAAAEISTAAGVILDPQELIHEAVELICERFELYYVGLFLVESESSADGGQWAVLRAGTGEPGRQMLADGHRLEVGGESMIGWCVANKEARIALDVGEEAVRFDNPWLPDTRSEMALPLISRGEIIGALSIQSDRPAAFEESDIATLQMMAAQLANVIANARLVERAEKASAELEATQRRYLQETWSEVTQARESSGYEQSGTAFTPIGRRLLPEVRRAMVERRTVVGNGAGGTGSSTDGAGPSTDGAGPSTLTVPLMLRGQPIGALGFRAADDDHEWSADDIAFVEALGEQLSLAAENLRLLDETQRRAARERLARDITDKMRRAASIEGVVQAAVDELFEALGTSRTFVQLGVDSSDGDDGRDG